MPGLQFGEDRDGRCQACTGVARTVRTPSHDEACVDVDDGREDGSRGLVFGAVVSSVLGVRPLSGNVLATLCPTLDVDIERVEGVVDARWIPPLLEVNGLILFFLVAPLLEVLCAANESVRLITPYLMRR